MRFITRLISSGITLALIGLAVLMALSNPHETSISLWPFETQFDLPVWLMVMVSFGLGLFFGGVAMLAPLFTSRLAQRRLQKTVNKLEQAQAEKAQAQQAEQNVTISNQH